MVLSGEWCAIRAIVVQSVRDVFPIKINNKLNLKMNVHKIYTRIYTMQVAICIPIFGSGLTAKKSYSHIPGKESFHSVSTSVREEDGQRSTALYSGLPVTALTSLIA